MSDFSKSPQEVLRDSQDKGYTGIHIEQGVPILDRDLNLMHDLLAYGMRSVFSRYIGNGVPEDQRDAFAIRALEDGHNENNFQIVGPGACLANGIEATIAASTDYDHQPNVSQLPPQHPSRPTKLTTPSEDEPELRSDIVFLDIFLVEVGGTPDLENRDDVGMQTSVRIKPVWTVRVAEDAEKPPDKDEGHFHYPLAQLLRRRGESKITEGPLADDSPEQRITDLRHRRLTVAALESRLSRLEQVLYAPSFTQEAGQIVPRQGRVNKDVRLSGNNFDKGALEVLFDDVPARLGDERTNSEIVVLVPGGLTRDGKPRDVKITVRNEIGSAVSDRLFTVRAAPVFAPPPKQFEPPSGRPGTPVTLFGFNFTPGVPTVTFVPTAGGEGKKAMVLPDATYNKLRVEVPEGFPQNTSVKINISFPDRAQLDRSTDPDAKGFVITA